MVNKEVLIETKYVSYFTYFKKTTAYIDDSFALYCHYFNQLIIVRDIFSSAVGEE